MPIKKKKRNNFNLLNSKIFLLALFPAVITVAATMILSGVDSINTFSAEAAKKKMRLVDMYRVPYADGYYTEWDTFDELATTTSTTHYDFVDDGIGCNGNDWVYSTSSEKTDTYIIDLSGVPNRKKIEKIEIIPCTAAIHQVNTLDPDGSGFFTTSTISFFYRYNGVDSSGKSYKVVNTILRSPSPATPTWDNVGIVKNASSTLEIGIVHLSGSAGLKVSRLGARIWFKELQ